MPRGARRGTISVMSATLDLTRRVLVPIRDLQPVVEHAPRVRHYRLARLPLHTRPDPMKDRFVHLRRSYD
jgi:hypothetical protein